MAASIYVVALGSNRRGHHGPPRAEVAAALRLLGGRASPIVASAPLGPSTRTFANAATVIASEETPPELLARLKRIEREAGRRNGRRWGARVLDLDIVLWSGGRWRSPTVMLPHVAFRDRAFVLTPMLAVAAMWRDPVSGLRVRQLHARLTRARPAPSRQRSA